MHPLHTYYTLAPYCCPEEVFLEATQSSAGPPPQRGMPAPKTGCSSGSSGSESHTIAGQGRPCARQLPAQEEPRPRRRRLTAATAVAAEAEVEAEDPSSCKKMSSREGLMGGSKAAAPS